MFIQITSIIIVIIIVFALCLAIFHFVIRPALKADAVEECKKLRTCVLASYEFGNAFGVQDFTRIVLLSDRYLIPFDGISPKDLARIAANDLDRHLSHVVKTKQRFYSRKQLRTTKKELRGFRKAWGIE